MSCFCGFLQFLAKYSLILFNIACLLIGTLLIVLGSVILTHLGALGAYSQVTLVPILIITIGAVIFVIAFLGCCGACRENTCMTYTYSVIMIVILCCQLSLIFYVWLWREKFLSSVTEVVDEIWKHRQAQPQILDALQSTFSCCGMNGFKDYIKDNEEIPLSCCAKGATECLAADTYSTGCFTSFENYWRKSSNYIIIGGLIGAAVEIAAVVFSCCLATKFRYNKNKEVY